MPIGHSRQRPQIGKIRQGISPSRVGVCDVFATNRGQQLVSRRKSLIAGGYELGEERPTSASIVLVITRYEDG